MTAVPITPLDHWIRRRIGADRGRPLTRTVLASYQLQALNRTIDHARRSSPFYRTHLAGLSRDSLTGLDRLADLPFTTAADLRRDPMAFVCVSQSEIARVVTMESSGTSGRPKRIFFTAADLERTVDFFHHGMSTLVHPGQRVMILLPGERPGSVGDLLVRGLARMAVDGIVHGPVSDPPAAIAAAVAAGVDSLVGIPAQVLAMAGHARGKALTGRIRTVLLSTDYVPAAIVGRLQRVWGCRVFRHYGMTEMGLGGGVECAARDGYHLREADLLVEIVDPQSGRPLPDGCSGEIVVTTLTREGMPLIRYRTGDLAAFRIDSCPCGTALKTLDAVRGRLDGPVSLPGGGILSIGELDEALFGVEALLDYGVEMTDGENVDRLRLRIACEREASFAAAARQVQLAVAAVPAIAASMAAGRLRVDIEPAASPAKVSDGRGKRRISDRRERKIIDEYAHTNGL
jgi:phenylacetate-CoA ligase